jgi:putative Mg2+ transporter-C (MgtC) family protein
MDHLLALINLSIQATPAATAGAVLLRLMVSALLGGVIGIEREMKRRPAGLRTNMFICFGAALFTMLSALLSGGNGDMTRIAAQIIAGIGFIGAGSILHSRGGVQGLTTAATVFVVAAIGMCAGGGLMIPATLATLLVLFGLLVLGLLERHVFVRPHTAAYQAVAAETRDLYKLLDDARAGKEARLLDVKISAVEKATQVEFTLEAYAEAHRTLRGKMRQEFDSHKIISYSSQDEE